MTRGIPMKIFRSHTKRRMKMKRIIDWIREMFSPADIAGEDIPDYVKILQSIADDSKL